MPTTACQHDSSTSRSRGAALHVLMAFAVAFLLSAPAFAQQRIEVREGGLVIIHEQAANVRFGLQPTQLADTIPPDEELRKVELSDELLVHVARLDHADFPMRESAMQALVSDPGDNLPLFALLARSTELGLSAEQHNRILSAVRERILGAVGGAIGISMRQHQQVRDGRLEAEVEVIDLVPGLPAIEVLRIGDRITAIDGERFASQDELTMRIQRRKPGDNVTITVHRPRRDEHGRFILNEQNGLALDPIEVPITLGSTDRLRNPPTGLPPNTMIADHRTQEASEAERRFRREPVRIEIDGELSPPSRAAVRMLDAERDQAVEQHPAIQYLKIYRERVETGVLAFDPPAVHQELNMLQLELRRPDITERQREFLARVVERYLELMLEFD